MDKTVTLVILGVVFLTVGLIPILKFKTPSLQKIGIGGSALGMLLILIGAILLGTPGAEKHQTDRVVILQTLLAGKEVPLDVWHEHFNQNSANTAILETLPKLDLMPEQVVLLKNWRNYSVKLSTNASLNAANARR